MSIALQISKKSGKISNKLPLAGSTKMGEFMLKQMVKKTKNGIRGHNEDSW